MRVSTVQNNATLTLTRAGDKVTVNNKAAIVRANIEASNANAAPTVAEADLDGDTKMEGDKPAQPIPPALSPEEQEAAAAKGKGSRPSGKGNSQVATD